MKQLIEKNENSTNINTEKPQILDKTDQLKILDPEEKVVPASSPILNIEPADEEKMIEDEENDIFLESDFIIVECSECGKIGYVIAERI